MAGIDLGTIQQDLARRFAAPLPEFYKRRIIFWYDEEHLGQQTGSNSGKKYVKAVYCHPAYLTYM